MLKKAEILSVSLVGLAICVRRPSLWCQLLLMDWNKERKKSQNNRWGTNPLMLITIICWWDIVYSLQQNYEIYAWVPTLGSFNLWKKYEKAFHIIDRTLRQFLSKRHLTNCRYLHPSQRAFKGALFHSRKVCIPTRSRRCTVLTIYILTN